MAPHNTIRIAVSFGTAALIVFWCGELRGAGTDDLEQQLQQLQKQNDALREQLRQQQALIDALTSKVNAIQNTQATNGRELQNLEATTNEVDASVKDVVMSGLNKVIISGEGGAGVFGTGPEGMYPNPEFRLDEARLFLDAPIWGDVYFYGELNLATPEEPDVQVRLGEAYVDFEKVSQLWGGDRELNVRVGRMYIPFGEEYQTRYAIDNPFVSRSLSDLWGVNAGLELYGAAGKFCYVVAAQNGGISDTFDGESDKSVAGRLGYDPVHWLHLSVSAMRTGNLSVTEDAMSALWFANGFFRSIGSPATTSFNAKLVEGDVQVSLPHGHLKAFGGYINYEDNDPAGNNHRNIYYYSIDGVQDITGKLYGGVRFSQILAGGGFPLVGYGNFDDYFFSTLTTELWRLSLCVGYRFSPALILKAEYSFERGTELGGEVRNHEDFAAIEAAFKF